MLEQKHLETVLKFKAGQRRGILALTKAARSAHTRSGLVRLPLREALTLKWETDWQRLGKPIFQTVNAQKIDADRPF